jgi:hypothetical protein
MPKKSKVTILAIPIFEGERSGLAKAAVALPPPFAYGLCSMKLHFSLWQHDAGAFERGAARSLRGVRDDTSLDGTACMFGTHWIDRAYTNGACATPAR